MNDSGGVALCHNGRVISEPDARRDVIIVDTVSGVKMSDRRYDSLFVDTSGALLWVDADNTIIVNSGPNSAGHTLIGAKKGIFVTYFRYGVYVDRNDVCQVLRFDL